MRAYRTESTYYFSSTHLMACGALVFFSEKLRRYIHPVEGFLLDAHPRVQILPEAESEVLETKWHDALARYANGRR
jgi:hypothetical protein